MIKKLIIGLLVCGLFWGLIRQLHDLPAKSKLANKVVETKINNKEIKSTAVEEKKFIPDEIKQSKNAVIAAADHVKSDDQMKTNAIAVGNYSNKHGFHGDEIVQTEATTSPTSNLNFTWNGVKLIAVKTAANHFDNTQRKKISSGTVDDRKDKSKQQNQFEDQRDISVKTDKVYCPPVKKIQLAAQQITDAFLYEGTYRLTTEAAAFQDSDLSWLVGVRGIEANSSYEAIYKAIIAVSETNHHKIEYAEKVEGGPFILYFCSYGPGDIVAIGIRNEELVEK